MGGKGGLRFVSVMFGLVTSAAMSFSGNGTLGNVHGGVRSLFSAKHLSSDWRGLGFTPTPGDFSPFFGVKRWKFYEVPPNLFVFFFGS